MKHFVPVLVGLSMLFGSARAHAVVKVACVGDSITLGARATTPQKTYPALLGALLGSGYDVRNFGHSGATVLKRGDYPYWSWPEYPASDAFNPDVVVIMLGTNDSKANNWSLRAGFDADYKALVDHYRKLGTHPKVYVALPTPAFGDGGVGIRPMTLAQEVIPAVKKAATDTGAPIIDVFAALSSSGGDFPDTVHPNDAGNAKIAAAVYAALRDPGTDGGTDARSDGPGDVAISTDVVDSEGRAPDVAADPQPFDAGAGTDTAANGAGGKTAGGTGSGGQSGAGGGTAGGTSIGSSGGAVGSAGRPVPGNGVTFGCDVTSRPALRDNSTLWTMLLAAGALVWRRRRGR